MEGLDPRWEWIEVRTFGTPGPAYVRGNCRHLDVAVVDAGLGKAVHRCLTCQQTVAERPCPHAQLIDVETLDGTLVARLCPACDSQFSLI